ncbi:RING finger protein unkempt homolog isoform X2 [Liolophura sinensis]|uniref:RING finger protein unkempt homolog isoform X2 n=1 Tax=Liolophura sinensis TaxID=3198878 RepID=UPI0031599183
MPSEALSLPLQTEKPHHYMYLKEFRTQQCPLFLQHKCTQHRPFTCFHWHFMNQRRRRPIRKRDGTFNYSPDVYCTKYDETTGLCPEGDECPYLHRTAGDTERRYHLRYYKTGTCVHETDSKGHCVKNGPHCAFAHGADDLRPPVYDVRELQAMETTEKTSNLATPSSLEKERILNEDPRWNDTNYVLANYKTEQCKRPPRLCRQGYACPQYHNSRDRRRSPKKFKYRSTPCPNVKHGDEWGDPTHCENGDNCAYCHTRTEQQFHPEIYKSTKCNDMVQTSYCPRGPFCAFAHVEHEMTTQRELSTSSENSLAAFVTNALPQSNNSNNSPSHIGSFDSNTAQLNEEVKEYMVGADVNNRSLGHVGKERSNSMSGPYTNHLGNNLNSNHNSNSVFPEPIGKGRSSSTSSSITSDPSSFYQRAPGSEREDSQVKLRQQLQAIENDPTLDTTERAKRKQNLILLHNLNIGVPQCGVQLVPSPSSVSSSSMSPLAPSFYPPGDTVESVVGNALDDLCLEDFDISSIDRELDRDNDTNSVSSSLSAGLSASGCFGSVSGPVSIPHSGGSIQRGSVGSLSQSPPSPLGSFHHPQYLALQIQQPPAHQQHHKQEQQLEQAHAAFLSQANPGKFSVPACSEGNSMSPRSGGPHSPLYSASNQGIQEELNMYKKKLASWEDGYSQAKSACDAWKKEAEESVRKAKAAEEEKQQILRQRDEALNQLKKVEGSSSLRSLHSMKELENLPLPELRHLQQQLRVDLERVEKIVFQHAARKCLICQDQNRNVVLMPCSHYVVCDSCAGNCTKCPFCQVPVTQRSSLLMPPM